ncbi:hypothetical protein Q75_10450 [Bacillus coahuilensis p1.1.43]|uniref:DUF2536 domain-containing protein n=1 Tax=Bacillus coahuilensis p1.1.43 TaxID=1150625 RepID=A0A147K6X8_9BACI|nr:DUF2536 family protein [Bacillus coahuilensis]KUP05804.1 hypothetical protein Q75_10450 [Bacillus coahuilensis p1.1.43]
MNFKLNLIQDKIEFFEARDIQTLEKKVSDKVEQNQALFLTVASVTHQASFDPDGKPLYTAAVHFKLKA